MRDTPETPDEILDTDVRSGIASPGAARAARAPFHSAGHAAAAPTPRTALPGHRAHPSLLPQAPAADTQDPPLQPGSATADALGTFRQWEVGSRGCAPGRPASPHATTLGPPRSGPRSVLPPPSSVPASPSPPVCSPGPLPRARGASEKQVCNDVRQELRWERHGCRRRGRHRGGSHAGRRGRERDEAARVRLQRDSNTSVAGEGPWPWCPSRAPGASSPGVRVRLARPGTLGLHLTRGLLGRGVTHFLPACPRGLTGNFSQDLANRKSKERPAPISY